jgi:DNA-binding protein H-NS
MPKRNLGSMSVESLLQLRDDVAKELARKATELQNQLARLGTEVAPSVRRAWRQQVERTDGADQISRQGRQHLGRGATPRWLREKLKVGAKLDDFLIQPSARKRRKK